MLRPPSGKNPGCVSIRLLFWCFYEHLSYLKGPALLFKPGFLCPAAAQQQEKTSTHKQLCPTCLVTQQGSGMVANSLLQLQLLIHILNSEKSVVLVNMPCNPFLSEDVKVDQTRGEVLCWCVHMIAMNTKHGRLCGACYIDKREHSFNSAICL